MAKKKMVDSAPVREMLKLERMYHRTMMPMAMYLEYTSGKGKKYCRAVTRMNAMPGDCTSCTSSMPHWVNQADLWPMALSVQTVMDDAKGSMADSSLYVRPMGIRQTARTGKMMTAPAPVSSNQ